MHTYRVEHCHLRGRCNLYELLPDKHEFEINDVNWSPDLQSNSGARVVQITVGVRHKVELPQRTTGQYRLFIKPRLFRRSRNDRCSDRHVIAIVTVFALSVEDDSAVRV